MKCDKSLMDINFTVQEQGRYYSIGKLTKIKELMKYLGPAFIVSVAYIDPGNFATNIRGGSVFNYSLIWVILWSNLMAIFLQSMSAKLGIATDHNLPEMCSKAVSYTHLTLPTILLV